MVQIQRILAPPADWEPERLSTLSVAANVRGNERWPLVLQSKFGSGNVVVFTTTAGPQWNNWTRNGTFPPTLLLVENLLATGRYPNQDWMAGQIIPFEASVAGLCPGEHLDAALGLG